MSYLINILLFITSSFLILLVLVQRGRGGGLAGALGGMGGQSAFGTKAGDVFTKVTVVTAAVWICLCAAAVVYFRPESEQLFKAGQAGVAAPAETSGAANEGASNPAASGQATPGAEAPPATGSANTPAPVAPPAATGTAP